MAEYSVFVVCDQHPKAVAVYNFDRMGPGEWMDRFTRTDPTGDVAAAGETLLDDEPYDVSRDGLRPSGEVRSRYRLRCRKCDASQVFRKETLWPILDRLKDAGVSTISLGGLAAIVASSSTA